MSATFRVLKYDLGNYPQKKVIELSENHTILSVQNQNDRVVLWALVDENLPTRPVQFDLLFTGDVLDYHPCYAFPNHIGSVQLEGGSILIHVFESPIIPDSE